MRPRKIIAVRNQILKQLKDTTLPHLWDTYFSTCSGKAAGGCQHTDSFRRSPDCTAWSTSRREPQASCQSLKKSRARVYSSHPDLFCCLRRTSSYRLSSNYGARGQAPHSSVTCSPSRSQLGSSATLARSGCLYWLSHEASSGSGLNAWRRGTSMTRHGDDDRFLCSNCCTSWPQPVPLSMPS